CEMEDQGGPPPKVTPLQIAPRYIQPPSDLTPDELCIFDDVVRNHPRSHFMQSDGPLLAARCAAANLLRLYAEHRGNEVARKMRLETAKLTAMLASRLRLGS